MPFIPNVPGVPPLTSYAPDAVTSLLITDVISAAVSFFFGPVYGIFLDGIPVLTVDNYVRFEHKQDFEIATYPVELGQFQAYDKVRLPGEIKVRVSVGGSPFSRQVLLAELDAVMNTVFTYDVVTPEHVYLNYNFMRRDLIREGGSAGLLAVDIVLMEILQSATAFFQTTLTPAVAGTSATGLVEAQTVPDSFGPGGPPLPTARPF